MASNFISAPSTGVNILPDSRAKKITRRTNHLGFSWIPIYCANCGKDGGFVPEDNCNFAFYLCNPCSEKLGPIANTYMEPDKVFWQKVHDAQIEEFGRELTAPEIIEALKDGDHILSKLAKERNK